MSDNIKHECGIAIVRLLKPLSFYKEKYGTSTYGLNKLYLLMEKQHNRGQDGVGLVSLKLNQAPGTPYLFRERSNSANPIIDLFARVNKAIEEDPSDKNPFVSEIFLGHLRYGTFGRNSLKFCHPVLRKNNWKAQTIAVAGNFNMTNIGEVFKELVDLGQHPDNYTDTQTIMESIGIHLDKESQRLYSRFKKEGHSPAEISHLIEQHIDLKDLLTKSSKNWDGGYVMGGMLGHGDLFLMRDPRGIRPAFYYVDDEIAVMASERPVIQTAMNVDQESIQELPAGHAITIRKNGDVNLLQIGKKQPSSPCSFERIYFSRGNDVSIYSERKKLGKLLAPQILELVDYDLKNTVLSYIPNTAETAFYGMCKGIEAHLNHWKKTELLALGADASPERISQILSTNFRAEKVAIKDAKMRTFITNDSNRDELVEHIYDVTYGVINQGSDTLVVIDDSIVRGTTLKKSILRILDRLNPKRIIIVSSAPQIRYPDCYGIDMAKIGDLCAFSAAIELLKETGKAHVIDDVYQQCIEQLSSPKEDSTNVVKQIYAPFSADEISKKVSEMLKPPTISADVDIVFNSIENLHAACPNHKGDWYFTGNYPTPGGNKVVNQAFINYYEGNNSRAY